MTKTMRERLIEVAAKALADAAYATSDLFPLGPVPEDYRDEAADLVDAILAELANPDEATIKAGAAAKVPDVPLHDSEGTVWGVQNGWIAGRSALPVFTAMIQAIREGK